MRTDAPLSLHRAHWVAACTNATFNQSITVFSEFLHMHHFGQKMYTEVYDKDGNFDW